jgi:hypothetical protein
VFTSVDNAKFYTPAADVNALEPAEPELLCELCHRDATKWKHLHVKPDLAHQQQSDSLPVLADSEG